MTRIKRVKTIPRGYRLKPDTHKLIAKIQRLMKASADEVINVSCSKQYEKLKDQQKNKEDINKYKIKYTGGSK
jgi:plasmid maintenance system killer protein